VDQKYVFLQNDRFTLLFRVISVPRLPEIGSRDDPLAFRKHENCTAGSCEIYDSVQATPEIDDQRRRLLVSSTNRKRLLSSDGRGLDPVEDK
jgi:hypothetical protein